MGAFLAGLRLGFLAVLAVIGVNAWWRSAGPAAVASHEKRRPPVPARLPGAPAPIPVPDPLPEAAAAVTDADVERLRARRLFMPVEGFDLSKLRDGFREPRGRRIHRAIDLLAPRGTRVRAVDDGSIRKLFVSAGGGISIYQYDSDGRYCYFYAHLDRYAPFLTEGKPVRKGEVLGFVGSTGNATGGAPHLHFAIFRIDDAGRWWSGTPVNPFPLWAASSRS